MKPLCCIMPFLFVCWLVCLSCNSTKNVLSADEIKALPTVLAFSKSACRGRCPQFDMTIYEGGWVIFDGKRFTEYEGKAHDRLTKEEYAQLLNNCRAADLPKYESQYGMNVMDIPTTTIEFFDSGQATKIQYKMRAPDALPRLSNQIMELIYIRDWVKRPNNLSKRGDKLPAGALENELIVHFNENIDINEWCQKYDRFGLASKRIISKSSNIYLLVFNTEQIPPAKMLATVKKDEKVQRAEFNKKLESRTY